MTSLFRKLMWWVQRRRKEDELREELQFHLEEEADERRADGLPEDQAGWAARRDLGNVTLLREDTRTLWTWTLLEQLAQDIRYGLRALRRSPGFAAVAILTLALGIGVNTAIFSVINAVVLRPLPYREPATLVLIDTSPLILAPEWLTTAWRDRARTLSDFAGFNGPRAATLVHAGTSHQIDAADVTLEFPVVSGRGAGRRSRFRRDRARRGAPAVGLLSHELWRRAFGSDEAIVGKTLTITGNPVTIVGVAPAGFRFPAAGALPATGMPADTQPDVLRVANADAPVNVIGRLAPGKHARVGHRRAPGDLQAGGGHSVPGRGASSAGTPCRAAAGSPGRQRPTAALARHGRGRLRHAGRLRQRRQPPARPRVDATARAGPADGVGCAPGQSGAARAHRKPPARAARLGRRAPVCLHDQRRRSYLAGRSHAARRRHPDRRARARLQRGRRGGHRHVVRPRLAAGRQASQHGRRFRQRRRLRSLAGAEFAALLLSAETAVTFVLVIGAALFVQTLWNLSAQDKGFDADRLLTVRVSPGLPPDLDRRDFRAGSTFFALFFSDLRDRLQRIPGVASAGAVSLGPLDGISSGFGEHRR